MPFFNLHHKYARIDERYLDNSGNKNLRHDLVYKANSHLQKYLFCWREARSYQSASNHPIYYLIKIRVWSSGYLCNPRFVFWVWHTCD